MFTQREKITFYATVGTFVLALAARLLGPVLFDGDSTLDAKIASAKSKLVKYRSLTGSKQAIEASYAKAFPGAQVAPGGSLLSDLEAMAREAGVRVLDMHCEQDTVDMRVEGKMADQLKFIYGIERSSRDLRLKRLNFMAQSGSGLLEAGLSMVQGKL